MTEEGELKFSWGSVWKEILSTYKEMHYLVAGLAIGFVLGVLAEKWHTLRITAEVVELLK